MPAPSSATASTASPPAPSSVIEIVGAAVLERVREQLAEDERERRGALAGELDRLELGGDLLARRRAPGRASREAGRELGEIDDVPAVLGQLLVHRGDREDPVDRVAERLLRVDALGPRLEPQERGDRLQVVLDPVVDLLGEHAAQRHPPVLERDRRLVRDRVEQLPVVVGERGVAVDDELADRAAAPAERQPHGVGARAALRPRDPPVLEDDAPPRSRGATRPSSGRSPRATPPGRATPRPPPRSARAPRARRRAGAPARRASHARSTAPTCDAIEVSRPISASRERARLARADVERALQHVAGEDRHGEDRLVLVLAAGSGTP